MSENLQSGLGRRGFLLSSLGIGAGAALTACTSNAPAGGPPVTVLPVTPWGAFVPATNACVGWAVREGFALVCFQSLEVCLPAPAPAEYVPGTHAVWLALPRASTA